MKQACPILLQTPYPILLPDIFPPSYTSKHPTAHLPNRPLLPSGAVYFGGEEVEEGRRREAGGKKKKKNKKDKYGGRESAICILNFRKNHNPSLLLLLLLLHRHHARDDGSWRLAPRGHSTSARIGRVVEIRRGAVEERRRRRR